MSTQESTQIGTMGWRDLTIPDAGRVCEFYRKVVGWEVKPLNMGAYDDYCMIVPSTGETVAGICHARGSNADVPPQWLVYIIVEDVDKSAARCVELGGKIRVGPREMGGGRFCVIQDPAGAVCALFRGPG